MDETTALPSLLADSYEDKKARVRRFLGREDAIDQICENIANGGSIPSIAKILKVYPSHITRWIRADADRTKRYEAALSDRDEWEVETVLSKLRAINEFDITSILDEEGKVLPPAQWPQQAVAAIQSFESKELYSKDGDYLGTNRSVKHVDSLKALELSGKRHSLFDQKIQHTGHVTLEQLVLGMEFDEDGEPEDMH